jgi:tetratricopeptide (TPR) repeat protein
VKDVAAKLTKRKQYTVKDLLNDLKKIEATPSVMYDVGSELVYRELDWCRKTLGDDHDVTANLQDLIQFMQKGYEAQLVTGEFWRVKDTPKAAINAFMRERPDEFLKYPVGILSEQIHEILRKAQASRKLEIKQYKKLVKNIRKEIKADKEDPNLWNKLRLVLWIIGKYNESSEAFKTAKQLGWTIESSTLVAL